MNQHDFLHRFLFEERGIRGVWIQLSDCWQITRQKQLVPETAQHVLGQALVAVSMLSASIKYNGSMILQTQSNGAIKTLVAQATHDRKIRGLVRSDDTVPRGSLEQQFGEGQLVLTIKSEQGSPYQGIIALQGQNLAKALENYFNQSEQLKTRLWLFADSDHAAGFLLQELPGNPDTGHWEHIEILAGTITEQELLNLGCQQILYRLFHQETIRLFDAEPITFECVCSRAKIEKTLKSLGRQEMDDILSQRGNIEVGCEFCNTQYVFDAIDITKIFTSLEYINPSTTRH